MKRLSKAKRRRRMKVLCVSVLATVISVLVVGGILAVKSEFLKVFTIQQIRELMRWQTEIILRAGKMRKTAAKTK